MGGGNLEQKFILSFVNFFILLQINITHYYHDYDVQYCISDGIQHINGSLNSICLGVWKGRNPVEEESNISSDQEDGQPLEDMSNGHTLLLTCLPGLG